MAKQVDISSTPIGHEPEPSRAWAADLSSPSLAEQLWGACWQEGFPLTLSTGVSARRADYLLVRDFLAKHFNEIFFVNPDALPKFKSSRSAARDLFYQQVSDHFAFYSGDELVGVLTGNAVDWSTYYVRTIALLPQAQGRGIQREVFQHLVSLLAPAGVERIEIEVLPGNVKQMRALGKMHFQVIGTKLSERWGALVQLAKFLSPESERAFADQYCLGLSQSNINQRGERRNI